VLKIIKKSGGTVRLAGDAAVAVADCAVDEPPEQLRGPHAKRQMQNAVKLHPKWMWAHMAGNLITYCEELERQLYGKPQ
jgi:hypothetical protein